MTTDNWLTIALIITNFIALLIGPVIAAFVMSRISQPKPTPVASQQKNRIQRMGGWLIRFFQSPWKTGCFIVLPSILADIYLLRGDLRRTAPVTRVIVFQICLEVAGIVYNLLNLGMIFIWQAIGRQADIILTETNTVSKLLDIVRISNELTKATTDDLYAKIEALAQPHPLEIEPAKPPQGTLRKLLTGIKNLFGD